MIYCSGFVDYSGNLNGLGSEEPSHLFLSNNNTKKVKCGALNTVCRGWKRKRERETLCVYNKINKTKIKLLLLLGHRRALCPGCRHTTGPVEPVRLLRFWPDHFSTIIVLIT